MENNPLHQPISAGGTAAGGTATLTILDTDAADEAKWDAVRAYMSAIPPSIYVEPKRRYDIAAVVLLLSGPQADLDAFVNSPLRPAFVAVSK